MLTYYKDISFNPTRNLINDFSAETFTYPETFLMQLLLHLCMIEENLSDARNTKSFKNSIINKF